eukprot:832280_1
MSTLTNIQHLPEYSGIKEAPQTALQVDEKMTEHDVTEHDVDDNVNKHSLWGISLILLGTFLAAVMFLLVKLLSSTNTFTLVFYRSLVQIILSQRQCVLGFMVARFLLLLMQLYCNLRLPRLQQCWQCSWWVKNGRN